MTATCSCSVMIFDGIMTMIIMDIIPGGWCWSLKRHVWHLQIWGFPKMGKPQKLDGLLLELLDGLLLEWFVYKLYWMISIGRFGVTPVVRNHHISMKHTLWVKATFSHSAASHPSFTTFFCMVGWRIAVTILTSKHHSGGHRSHILSSIMKLSRKSCQKITTSFAVLRETRCSKLSHRALSSGLGQRS